MTSGVTCNTPIKPKVCWALCFWICFRVNVKLHGEMKVKFMKPITKVLNIISLLRPKQYSSLYIPTPKYNNESLNNLHAVVYAPVVPTFLQ